MLVYTYKSTWHFTQKTNIDIFTTVKTSNLILLLLSNKGKLLWISAQLLVWGSLMKNQPLPQFRSFSCILQLFRCPSYSRLLWTLIVHHHCHKVHHWILNRLFQNNSHLNKLFLLYPLQHYPPLCLKCWMFLLFSMLATSNMHNIKSKIKTYMFCLLFYWTVWT